MTDYLRVVGWEQFQHYKDRDPIWIKLHRTVLDSYEFGRLQDASKAHLMLIWLLAGRLGNRIPNDPAWIGRRISATSTVDLQPLYDGGFIEDTEDVERIASVSVPSGYPRGEERRGEENRGEKSRGDAPATAAEPDWLTELTLPAQTLYRGEVRSSDAPRAFALTCDLDTLMPGNDPRKFTFAEVSEGMVLCVSLKRPLTSKTIGNLILARRRDADKPLPTGDQDEFQAAIARLKPEERRA